MKTRSSRFPDFQKRKTENVLPVVPQSRILVAEKLSWKSIWVHQEHSIWPERKVEFIQLARRLRVLVAAKVDPKIDLRAPGALHLTGTKKINSSNSREKFSLFHHVATLTRVQRILIILKTFYSPVTLFRKMKFSLGFVQTTLRRKKFQLFQN